MMNVTFHGAAQEVTGSLHVIEADGMKVALDCGLFQGRRAESNAKNEEFPFDPSEIHAVVLSHAHIDHCGRLPLLVRKGFTGRIFTTPATRDLCALLLRDSAHIQAEDVKYLNKKRARKGEPPVSPLYEDVDSVRTLKLFHTVPQEQPFWMTKRLKGCFHHAGHMLGSSMVELEYNPPDGKQPVKLVFSGDLGRFGTPILRDPHPLPRCDYLIIESTYGGRRHPPTSDLKGQLAEVVNETIKRRGKLIIPAFSVGRTQVIVYFLHQLQQEGRIPPIPTYIDSPLAVNATEVFRLHPELFDADAKDFQRETGDILGSSSCTYIRDVEESKKINRRRNSCIVISASGMCEAGRIRHHLKNTIRSAKNTILIVGFQAAHTLGRRIVEKQEKIRIFGQTFKVKAQVTALNGFSAHSDRDELQRLLKPLVPHCKQTFLVHGEIDQMKVMQDTMRTDGFRQVEMPASGQTFHLNGLPGSH
ncbi:MAG: MBL fold metallo-hydrolase [Phycisphaerales bacterium]|nr:MBL fold metallo-hydrolase [Phycisphaerales bacterium]